MADLIIGQYPPVPEPDFAAYRLGARHGCWRCSSVPSLLESVTRNRLTKHPTAANGENR